MHRFQIINLSFTRRNSATFASKVAEFLLVSHRVFHIQRRDYGGGKYANRNAGINNTAGSICLIAELSNMRLNDRFELNNLYY